MFWRINTLRRRIVPAWILILPALLACNLLSTTNTANTNTAPISGTPVVHLAAPLPNSTFMEGVSVNIQAQITNAGPDINRVEVVVDNAIVATLTSPNQAGAPAFSISQAWQSAGSGLHTVTVTAFRADGSSSAPASVNINVVSQGAPLQQASATPATGGQILPTTSGQVQPTNAVLPTNQPAPSNPPPPTTPPQPTAIPPSSTPSNPMATILQGANVRSGPSTLFNPAIGSFAVGMTAEILGVTPAGDWYKVRYYNGEGWVSAQLLSVSGDTARIPVDAGPPIPTLTPTPIPVTPTPVTSANLVFVGQPSVSPHPLTCNQTATIRFTIKNDGTTATNAGGSVTVQDILVSTGEVQQTAPAPGFGVLQPGQSSSEAVVAITVSTHYNEDHKIVIIIDSGNGVAETNENDNRFETLYPLQKGSC